MLALFFSAMALGFLFNAAPGAIFAESLRRGIAGGFGPALQVQIGSLVGDFTWAILGLGGVAALFQLKLVALPLALLGAALLAHLALSSFKDALRAMPDITLTPPDTARSDLSAGVALSLSNPMNITYWAGLGGTISALGVAEPTGMAFIVFLAGFMASSLLWCVICAGFIGLMRRMITPLIWRCVNIGCGLGLGYFAVHVLWHILMRA